MKAELDMISAYNTADEVRSLQLNDPLEGAYINPPALAGSNMNRISKGMSVVGDIDSVDAIYVDGKISGNIHTDSDAGINGLITGDVVARNIHFKNAGVRGNSTATDSATLEKGAVVVGNITAGNLSIDGKVKGIVRAYEKVVLEHNSLISGEIISNGISIQDGARISASITITDTAVEEAEAETFGLDMEG